MYPKGIIYKSGYPVPGEFKLRPDIPVRFLYHTLRGLGAGIIAYAVIFFMFTYAPLIKEEIAYTFGQKVQPFTLEELAKAKSTSETQEEAKKLGVSSYFSVVIPKIGASANIIANVDAGNETSYSEALYEGVAHAAGTYFPDQGKRIYLFSHSTNSPLNFARYNAVFYLLGKLNKGDRIVVFFADKKYIYEVSEKKTVAANDTSWIEANTNEEELVLQTCDPPGTTWRRLLVIAKPVLDIH